MVRGWQLVKEICEYSENFEDFTPPFTMKLEVIVFGEIGYDL